MFMVQGKQLHRIYPKCIITPRVNSKLTLHGGRKFFKRSFIYITDEEATINESLNLKMDKYISIFKIN